ncbi:discoidin domain-containing protein [Parapedobacter sp. 10938]|uniref:discoidin domain-containing protein n=1 Tax=Parapedobacter flavus TaxID=3110225 RepID=UPI002DB6F996|nr:discoidin domain-containing protein [Parapedobacter sp. 10938]MEC3878162.1 discoidin domain-containing protein [Parapedobacter sp. 10938]
MNISVKITCLAALLSFGLTIPLSCTNLQVGDIDDVLRQAGGNRGELEYVLAHYSRNPEDSLKHRAAEYLIKNMAFHYSFVMDETIENFHAQIEHAMDSLRDAPFPIKDSVYQTILLKNENLNYRKIADAKVITAEYLISNIEHSFKVWNNEPWSQHLSFEEFCEFILPYKVIEGQVLDDWKQFFYERYNKLLMPLSYSSIYSNSSYNAANTINAALRNEMHPMLNSESHTPIIKLKTLLSIPSGPCNEYGTLANAVMRANGIPTGMDFTPQWPFRSLGHSWDFLHENTKKNTVFEGANSTIGSPHKKDHIMAKVYRRTYGINKELELLIKNEQTVPRIFSTPYILDVTDEYMSTIDIELNVKTDNDYVYLAVFNNRNWEVLAWGENKRGKASFKSIGKDVLYLPVNYGYDGVEPIGAPFIVYLGNKIQTIKADTSRKQTLKLQRKFPLLSAAYRTNLRKIGAKIQGANRSDFSDSVTFHVFDNFENEVALNPERKRYRYWRVLSAPHGHSNVAELRFFKRGNAPVVGDIMGTDGSFRTEDGYTKQAAFDGDLLTFFDAPNGSGSWIGMDFKDSVAIDRVTCIMRGDGNEVEIGDEYELAYWMEGQWVSLGKKIAKDLVLEFANCPSDALFILHNRTKGKEERIFTYENGQQVWW